MAKNVDILTDPKSAFWKLSAPIIFLALFESFFSVVDIYWVSQLSNEAFFAISVTSPLVSLMNGFGTAISVGANSLISRELGENDLTGSYNSILHAIVTCIIISAVVMLSTLFLDDILAFMDVTSSVDLAMDYITPIFLSSIVFLLSSLFVSTLQSEGNSATPTKVLIVCNVINLILDPVLIFGLNMGVKGAAYASILSTLLTVVYFLYWYLSGKSKVVINFKYFKPGIVYEIFKVAIPNFIMSLLSSFLGMYINRILIMQLDKIGVLLYSTACKLELLIVCPQIAFGKSLVTISGQLFGADRIDDLIDMFKYTVKISVLLAIIGTVVFFFIRDKGFSLYSVTGAETYIFYIALAAIVIVPSEEISIMSSKMLDGMGKSYHALMLSVGLIIFEILIISTLEPYLTSGYCVLAGILISEFVFGIISYALVNDLLHGKNKMDEKLKEEKEEFKRKREEFEKENVEFMKKKEEYENKKEELNKKKEELYNRTYNFNKTKEEFEKEKLDFEKEKLEFEKQKEEFKKEKQEFEKKKEEFEKEKQEFEKEKLGN